MLKFITAIKGKLLLVGGAIIASLLYYIKYLRVKQLKGKIKRVERAQEIRNKSVDSMMEGMKNEDTKSNRGYFNRNK